MAVKLNGAETYEPITIILSKEITPIAYRNKIEEYVEQGLYHSIEEAEVKNPKIEIECEIYCEKNIGLFTIESRAVESGTIFSPYSGDVFDI